MISTRATPLSGAISVTVIATAARAQTLTRSNALRFTIQRSHIVDGDIAAIEQPAHTCQALEFGQRRRIDRRGALTTGRFATLKIDPSRRQAIAQTPIDDDVAYPPGAQHLPLGRAKLWRQ